jgi:hypothetical protein
MHSRYDGMAQPHFTSAGKVVVVRADAQQNGFDCGVWTLYALYYRSMKRATKQKKADLFSDMDMRTPQHALLFRFIATAA